MGGTPFPSPGNPPGGALLWPSDGQPWREQKIDRDYSNCGNIDKCTPCKVGACLYTYSAIPERAGRVGTGRGEVGMGIPSAGAGDI